MNAGPVDHGTQGRLGDPATTLGTDPRADPRMLAVFEPLGLLGHADPAPMDRSAGRPALLELGGTHVVVTGDSGGAGLALALGIAAKREGRLDRIAGITVQCPYILGTWDDPPPALSSLRENDRYWLNRELFPLLAEVYDPDAAHVDDPTCWPSRATVDDVRGLPPHRISCAELDPLRDEGMAYHRLLLAAGVPSVGTVELGVCHVGQILFREAMPDVYARAVDDVVSFARRVAP